MWREIQDELSAQQTAASRPDLVVRVFRLKMRALIDDLHYKGRTETLSLETTLFIGLLDCSFKGIFGRTVAFTYVMEYQKRGIPHAHILLIVSEENRLRTPSDVDATICAELPSDFSIFKGEAEKRQARRLREIVLKCMIHGPCSTMNPNSPCMVNGKCSKGYPKAFSNQTNWTQQCSYPNYRRRSVENDGASAVVGDYVVDNRWVVPYSPLLLLMYGAHINVEACVSPFAAKYLFLYINKVLNLLDALCWTDFLCSRVSRVGTGQW